MMSRPELPQGPSRGFSSLTQPPISKVPKRSIFTWLWLAWLAQFLLIEIPAVLVTHQASGTLSVHVWSRWFTGWTIWIIVFFLAVLAAHFKDRGRHWWSSGRAIVTAGLPVVLVILGREGMSWKGVGRFFGSIWRGGKKGVNWILRNGPIVSSAVLGVSAAYPAAAPVAKVITGALAVASGGVVPADNELVGLVTQVGVQSLGLIAAIGAVRKWWAKRQAAAGQ